MKRLFGVITLLLFAHILFAQPPVTEQQARAELDRRGVDESQVREKLLVRGIDIDKVDQKDPVRLLEVQKAIEEVLAEIESEKAGAAPATLPPPNPDPQPVPEQIIVDSTEAAIQEIKTLDVSEDVSEKFIEEYQETLPPSVIYGQHIFRDKSIALYRQSEDIKPPDSYVLGAGDIIAVSIWGISQEGAVYEINKSGFISPSGMPRIYLKGVSYGKAKDLLRNRFSSYYRFRPEEFELTINYSRTITVNIVGEAINYGSFTFPAINTAFNALVAAGGPSDIGSVRNIQLIRAGEQPKRIDIYEYLLDPSIQKDYYLQENDFISIPIAERLVTISGAVKRPYTFELARGEELKKLIAFAGGFKDNAYKGKIQIKRFINDEEILIDVDFRTLENTASDFQLFGSDVVTVQEIAKPYKNYIEISGSVEFPGRFELTPEMKISNLIGKAILLEEARKDVAFIQRSNIDGTARYEKVDLAAIITDISSAANLVLQPKDKLIIYTQKQFVDNADFSVTGSVRAPFKLPYSVGKEVKIDDAILLAGGLLPDATSFGYIIRTDPKNKKNREVLRVDIQKAIEDPSSVENIVLQPFDELRIYSLEALTDVGTISVNGAVREPLEISYVKNLTIKNIITLAGGLEPNATSFGYVTRRDLTNNEKRSILRVDIQKAFENPDSAENIILEPYDVLTIYSTETFTEDSEISVRGAVREPGTFPFASNFTLKDILTMSGGLKIEASTSRIEVFRTVFTKNQPVETVVATLEVDDELNIVSNGGNFELAPFDLIVVRRIPEFEVQQIVTINGEIKYPGTYPLINDNERLSSIIQRSGGITNEAFLEGATLYREEDNTGYIIVELDDVLKDKKTKNDFILKAGDQIEIPKQKNLVTIGGATKVNELYPEKIVAGGKINVAYRKNKNAKWYVDHYAAGVADNGQKKRITVEHPNGKIERTKNFLFFKTYPSVREGSIVTVGIKPSKKPKEEGGEPREKVDWGRTLADGLAQATAVLSLILLVQQVNK
jgi:protein involved in polysaccharide export with SLBB domain